MHCNYKKLPRKEELKLMFDYNKNKNKEYDNTFLDSIIPKTEESYYNKGKYNYEEELEVMEHGCTETWEEKREDEVMKYMFPAKGIRTED